MEIFNRVETSISKLSKIKQKEKKEEVSFKGAETVSSNSAVESMAKAKIMLDKAYTKPIPYETKVKMLKEREIPEEKRHIFLSVNDETFREMMSFVDCGLNADEVNSVYNGYWGNDDNRKAAELAKYNIPFSFAKNLFSYSGVPPEKIEFLKQAKFDFSEKREYFKVDEYTLKRVLRDENEFNRFNSMFQRGIDANLALYTMRLRDNELERVNKAIDENKTLSNSAAAAYCMGSLKPEEIKKVQELSQKYKLDANNYDFWLPVVKARDIERTGRLLELGVPLDCLKNTIVLNDEQVTDALAQAKNNNIPVDTSINIYQRTDYREDRRTTAYKLLKMPHVEPQYVLSLAGLDNPVAAEKAAGYMSRGIEYYNAVNLALLDKSDEDKEKIISLLPLFKDVSQSIAFLESDLSEEDSAKVLGLAQKGANLYLAKFCLQSPACYEKAKAIIDSNPEISLEGVYGGWEPETLKHLDLLSVGVPANELSFFEYSAKPEDIELLRSGVKYSALKTMKDYEEKGTNCSELVDFLKKGVEFKIAADICFNKLPSSSIPKEAILEWTTPALDEDDATKIMALATLQNEKGVNWQPEVGKDKLISYVSELKNVKNLTEIYDSGLLNDKAIQNYKELEKRGLSYENSDVALVLSQLDYKDSLQYDRVSEMLKHKVPFERILYSMNDDKAFIDAIKNYSNKEKTYSYITLCSNLVNFYNSGMKLEGLEKISNECFYKPKDCFAQIGEYLKRGHNVDDAVKISTYTSYLSDSFFDRNIDYEKTAKKREFFSEYILKGCSYDYLSNISYSEEKVNAFLSLVEQGFEPALAQKMVICGVKPTNEKKIARIKELESATINEDLKKASGNPNLYPMIDKLYNFNNYSVGAFSALVNSDVSLKDLFNSGKTFVKSPLKQAMKRPNLYLTDIPVEDTEKVNGEYPKLTPKKLADYQNRMLSFFQGNMSEITRALKYLDVDMFNQMMDKRTTTFSEQLEMLNKMNDSHYELASKLTKCRKDNGKLLSSKEKIDLSKIVLYHQMGYIDVTYLHDVIKNGSVNVSELNKQIFNTLMDTIGISPEEAEQHSDKLDFDEDYMYLLLRTQKTADFAWFKEALDSPDEKERTLNMLKGLLDNPENLAHNGLTEETAIALIDLLNRSEDMEEKDVFREYCVISPFFATVDITAQDIAKLAILQNFKSYIQDENNSIGQVNAKTKQIFEQLGLDYQQWVNYQEEDSIEFNGHKFDLKLWDRKPQKDLFMGNRTSCCTAIIDGGNGKATPIYLSNTAFNVVELTDENGQIVAMSRIFPAKVDENPSLIIENIEINNAFLKSRTEAELKELRDKMFAYIGDIASSISNGHEMDIYFSKNYTHVPLDDFTATKETVDFIGEISADKVYLNCKPGWVAPSELKNEACDLYQIS